MMNVAESYREVCENVRGLAEKCGRDPANIEVVAVSKTYSLEQIQPAYTAGCRTFGESRLKEALPKIDLAPKDISWHLVGSLQKNKVRKAIGAFTLIHSVDSYELAEKIASCSAEKGLTTNILIQVNTSQEPSKHGLTEDQWLSYLPDLLRLPNVAIKGLMTMAPLTQNSSEIRACFAKLRRFKEKLNNHLDLQHLSMGMTNDYPIAIEEGATLLRIGTAIFGQG